MKHRALLSAVAMTAALSLSISGTADAGQDSDRDGYDDDFEERHGSNPHSRHSDNDGIPDGQEYNEGTDPTKDDTDDDGFDDNVDNCPTVSNEDQSDSDGDGVGNACDRDTKTTPDGPLPGLPGPPGAQGGNEAVMGTDGYVVMTWTSKGVIWVRVKTADGADVPLDITPSNAASRIRLEVAPTSNSAFEPAPFVVDIRGPHLVTLKPAAPLTGIVRVTVPPIGYSSGCNGVEVRACGSFAMGYYNSLKLRNQFDALDAVPEPVFQLGA